MEGLQEHIFIPRAAGNIGQRSVKQEGGAGHKGGHAPMNSRNGKGKFTTSTKPAQ